MCVGVVNSVTVPEDVDHEGVRIYRFAAFHALFEEIGLAICLGFVMQTRFDNLIVCDRGIAICEQCSFRPG